VFVALGSWHAKRICLIIIRILSGSTIFFHIISWTAPFSKSGIEHKMCFDFLYSVCLWSICHSKEKWTRYYYKCISVFLWSTRCSRQILLKVEFSQLIFENILKHKISWKSILWEPRCSMRTDSWTDMTKLRADFLIFANAPKNSTLSQKSVIIQIKHPTGCNNQS
jgi:hypothetical protein